MASTITGEVFISLEDVYNVQFIMHVCMLIILKWLQVILWICMCQVVIICVIKYVCYCLG